MSVRTKLFCAGLTAVLIALTGVLVASAGAASGDCTGTTTITCTYTSTGSEQTFTVPARVTSVHVLAIGGAGGAGGSGNAGGYGDQVAGDLSVTSGATLYVEVGGNGGAGSGDCISPGAAGAGAGGFNGGASGGASTNNYDGGGGGGGGSDLRTATNTDVGTLASRLLVAGGGGGGGGCGGAGGNAGQDGGTAAATGGGGATGATWGLGGAGSSAGGGTTGGAGTDGSSGSGGAGGGALYDGGGGGGGGYFGGGGGGGNGNSGAFGGGGGGGGSSDVGALTNSSPVTTDATGTPSVTISYTAPAPVSSATLGCGYHADTTSDDQSHLYTNATDANEAGVSAGHSTSFLVDCTLSVSGTVTGVKVQGHMSASGKPVYAWVKDESGGSDALKSNKHGKVASSTVSTLGPGSYRLEVSISSALWKKASGSGTQLTGGWSLTYTDSDGAQHNLSATGTPLTINVS